MTLSHILFPSLVRGTDLVGMVLLMGGLVFKALVAPPTQNSRLELILPFFLLLTGISDLALRSQMISGRPLAEVWAFLPKVLAQSHFGKVWVLRTFLLCFLGAAPFTKLPDRWRQRLGLAAGLGLLLTASLSGHAADSGDLSLAVLADWLHLLGVCAWTGGLFFVGSMLKNCVSPRGPEPISMAVTTSLRRFSSLAGVCVILILATGGYQAWLQVGGVAPLTQTPYGQTLTAKLILALPLLALGALNRYRHLPKLSQHAWAQPVTSVRQRVNMLFRGVRIEIGLGLMIMACVALLTQLPPARGQLTGAYKGSAQPMDHMGHEKAPPPALQPAEGASVKILSPKEGQLFKGDEVPLRFKLVKGKRGSHVHAYVDGELMGMFQSEKGTLTGIQPGRHALELRVVAEDHQTELEARDQVHFMVK